jgi:nitrogen regulatory protein PII
VGVLLLFKRREVPTVKKVEFIIRPHKLDDVKDALTKMGIQGMTVTEVRGFGRQRGRTELYRGSEYTITFVPKVKIEVLLSDTMADEAIKVAMEAARTGKIGDGKITVYDLKEVFRIRTGETGEAAL